MNVETSAGRHPSIVRKILGGTGMATPVRTITVKYNGRRETLTPGRSRLAVDHELVRSRPEAFRPCSASDSVTRDRLRSMSTPGRTAARTATRAGSPRGGLNLPSNAFQAADIRVVGLSAPVQAAVTEGIAALLALLERVEEPLSPQPTRGPSYFGRREDRRHRSYVRRRAFGRDTCR